MDTEITGRIASLRAFMKERGLSAFIIPSTDPHSGEYVPAHWEARNGYRDLPVRQAQLSSH